MKHFFIAFLLSLSFAALKADDPTFEKDVRPILKAKCYHCHGEFDKPKGKLDLRLPRLMKKGGATGPALVVNNLHDSLLWEKVESDEMPVGDKKLSPAEKETLKKWITTGAKTLRPEPENPEALRITEEERAHWSFQPMRQHAVPTLPKTFPVQGPVDAFLGKKLFDAKLTFSPITSKELLIRRATFDLLGLPPTPEEVKAFVADTSQQAYEKLLDKLLASPHYGERWARHWLDVAGYSETDGSPGTDHARPHAYRYRDYVIASFNSDKPYDQFLKEQLAGDQLVGKNYNLKNTAHIEKLTATGFLRMAPDATTTENTLENRNQAVADVIKVTSSSILGLTVGCAQCHDHKYDPITSKDYYQLRAIFDPAMNMHQWKKPGQRQIDITSIEDMKKAEAIETEAKEKEKTRETEMVEAAKGVQEKELAKLPEEIREMAKKAAETEEAKQTKEQKELLKKHPNVKPISFIKGFFVEYDKKLHDKFTKQQAEIKKLRDTKPPRQFVMATQDQKEKPPETKVLIRGDPAQPGITVSPAEIGVLASEVKMITSETRRLEYANWLTTGTHPLTARVIVNRVWLHHFGKGIVNTPGDFGILGEKPSHPELLDWLAIDLAKNGWQLKRLHKQIMLSHAYQQQSLKVPEAEKVDPDNRLLARMNIRRLEAEAVRDSTLAITGELVKEVFGPSIPVTEDSEGKAVFGRRKETEGLFSGVDVTGLKLHRRSIYIENKRTLPLNMLETFDMPTMAPNCELRRNSTVATQSLLFLNDSMITDQMGRFSDKLFEQYKSTQERVNRVYQLLFSSSPTDEERKRCDEFLKKQEEYFTTFPDKEWQKLVKKNPHAAGARAMAVLCQTLLCSNRFLYVD